ncbi:MAG TPA: sialidase family protein [Chitinophagaceae bacterium]|nr:sialidase family protein [Chitinophagaceae bacterium]
MKKLLTVLALTGFIISCTNNKSEKKTVSEAVKELKSPASDSCAEPYLFTDKNGMVYLSWIEKIGKESKLKFSSLLNEQWTEPVVIASGNNWFVNWADYPVIAGDGNGNLIAHYLGKSAPGKFTYDVKYKISSDKGMTWSDAKILHDDGKQAEHGFVSMTPYGDKYFLSWLDGRNAAMVEGEGHDGHHGEMTIRGALINKDGVKENEWELDKRVCDCCQTSAAITANGPIVVYRDRSSEEIRDMSIVRYVNGNWTEPKTIFPDQWKIAGCPVNGPKADAIGNNLAIAWFSMPDKKGQVNLLFSEDGGETFSKPIHIDEGKPIGRVDVLMLDENSAMVSWMEGAEIKAVKVNKNGKKETSVMIAASAESRSSGFPQMTRAGDKLIFAWTDAIKKTINVSSLAL